MEMAKSTKRLFFLQVFAYHGVSSHKLTFQSRYSHQRNSEIASSKRRLRCKNSHTYLFEDKTCVVIVKFREVFVVLLNLEALVVNYERGGTSLRFLRSCVFFPTHVFRISTPLSQKVTQLY